MEVIKKNIAGYDATVDAYHDKTRDLEAPQIATRMEFASLLKGKKIIDIGCGSGRDAKFFSDLGFDVLGIDLSEKMVEKAKEVAPNAEFKVMNMLYLKLEEESFDGAWFSAALLSIEKKDAPIALENAKRALKNGGILYLSVKEGKGESFEFDHRYNIERYYAYYSEDELRGLLEKAGFKILKVGRPKLKSPYHTHQIIRFVCGKF